MAEVLLAKLKIKPIPKIQESIEVKIKKPAVDKEDVVIKTKITDKTKEALINREDFMAQIETTMTTKTKVPSQKSSIQKDLQEESIKKLSEEKFIVTDPSKLKKRLKLEPTEEISIEISVDEASSKEFDQLKDTKKTKTKDKSISKSEPKTSRITTKPIGIAKEGPTSLLIIGDEMVKNRIEKKDKPILVQASSYYMNNRQIFINFITSLFNTYKKDILKDEKDLSCDESSKKDFEPLTHQKIVKDYLNLYTPYRGLLLYHGLGSGKTCSSIGITEGLKNDKKVIIMTPASLRTNYKEELKKCGDILYKKNQFWEFISTKDNRELADNLSYILSLSVDYIIKNGGAWLVNIKKAPNYETLTTQERILLDAQIEEMIKGKYKFINYNGLRNSHLQNLTANFTINPFDNSVIVIDEAHNFVSRIVNKLKGRSDKIKKTVKLEKESLALKLYEYLMSAENAKIILLTGTPIINYPNEISILFNILRGYIKVFKFKLAINTLRKVNHETIMNIFKTSKSLYKFLDYIEYNPSSNVLTITQNPFGFISKHTKDVYDGVKYENDQQISTGDFIILITKILQKNNIEIIPGSTTVESFKALPDKMDDFKELFIDSKNHVKNENLFKRRILGLTSYFPDIDALLPTYDKGLNFHIVKIPMSDFQFTIYEEARVQERKLELKNATQRAKKGGEDIYEDSVSTYRIFSRAFCNFVFPRPTIKRPFPREEETLETAILENKNDEDVLDAIDIEQRVIKEDSEYEMDDLEELKDKKLINFDNSYENRIKIVIKELKKKSAEFLTPEALKIYSPKFLNILENLQDPEFKGLHLIYSHFRTLEGIGILKLILEANGFAQFKIKKNVAGIWSIDIPVEDKGKPTFALYTGTESIEEKEIIRNIFNSNWQLVPKSIQEELIQISSNNLYGEIIKVLMITASGAEGISLSNVRYVHITEPYWHPVRIEQVIGRARRICSHKNLPKEFQTVEVFLYLMTFSKEQLSTENTNSIELRLKDRSKIDNTTPLTSDEALYEISVIKENINKSILKAVKEAAIDCVLFNKPGNKDNLQCFTFGDPDPEKLAYQANYNNEEIDTVTQINKKENKIKAKKITYDGISYAYDPSNGKVFDYQSYINKNPVQIGTLTIDGKKFKIEWI